MNHEATPGGVYYFISPKLTNNLLWIVGPVIFLVMSVLIKRCSTSAEGASNLVSNMTDQRNPMDRYCVIFGKPYVSPSIHTLLKTFMKSVMGGVFIYLYVLASGLLNIQLTQMTPASILKYILGLIVLHDYLSTLFDTIVGLDVMYFPYEVYYVGIVVVCWILFNL